jgi:hypothetical protein
MLLERRRPIDRRAAQLLETICTNLDRLGRLVNDLLTCRA